MLDRITNYIQLTPTIATSGQPTVPQFSWIADAGYRCVINLAMPDSDDAIATEGRIVTELGMIYIHIPVPFDRPTPQHLRQFMGVMAGIEADPVWVHCVKNYRVSAFLYHYLRQKGYIEQEARSPIFQHWQPNKVWQQFLTLDHNALSEHPPA